MANSYGNDIEKRKQIPQIYGPNMCAPASSMDSGRIYFLQFFLIRKYMPVNPSVMRTNAKSVEPYAAL